MYLKALMAAENKGGNVPTTATKKKIADQEKLGDFKQCPITWSFPPWEMLLLTRNVPILRYRWQTGHPWLQGNRALTDWKKGLEIPYCNGKDICITDMYQFVSCWRFIIFHSLLEPMQTHYRSSQPICLSKECEEDEFCTDAVSEALQESYLSASDRVHSFIHSFK